MCIGPYGNHFGNSTFEAMLALNGHAHSDPTRAELAERIEKLPAKSQKASERTEGYVSRLLESFEN